MSKASLLEASMLRQKKLLTTKSRVNPEFSGEVEFELSHSVDLVLQDREKGASHDFYVDAKTELKGTGREEEVLKIAFTYRYDYDFAKKGVDPQKLARNEEEFAHILFLCSRTYLSHQLTEMGIDPKFLPFSLHLAAQGHKEISNQQEGKQRANRKKNTPVKEN